MRASLETKEEEWTVGREDWRENGKKEIKISDKIETPGTMFRSLPA